MSELNKIAREYLESLGLEVPYVEDAAPKTFDTLVATGPKVKGWESASMNGKPIIRNGRKLLTEDLRRNKAVPASSEFADRHIRDYKLGQRSAEEYKDAREMWDAINFQPLPIAAEEVVAPRAWRTWPTGSEIRALILVGIFVLSLLAWVVVKFS